MYRPTIKSNLWLGVMTIAFLSLFFWSETSRVTVRQENYQQRLDAANLMLHAIETLENFRLPALNLHQGRNSNDALVFTLLGEKDSPITTDEGRIDDKITVLNPNYAAAIVELLISAGVQKGDTIAVLLTGSMPGANLAVYSAAEALKIHPVIITSIGSSWWGANSVDFTWLDMEKVLADKGVFPFRSIAASIGGNDDNGGLRLSSVGRSMIVEAADRNEVTLIKQGSLTENIASRVDLFKRILPLNRYAAVVNIGGGIAALGHKENSNLIANGLNETLPIRNYPGRGVVHSFADEQVPIIHIYDVVEIAKTYSLPVAQLPLPKVGIGEVYETERYNLTVVAISITLMLLILIVVKYLDRQHYKWREEGVDPDTLV